MEDKKYKIWFDTENQIVHYDQIKDDIIDQKLSEEIIDAFDKIIEENPTRGLLIDLTNLKTIPDARARSNIVGLARKYSSYRIALVSKSLPLRVTINFIVRAAGHPDVRAIDDVEAAVKWIKGKS